MPMARMVHRSRRAVAVVSAAWCRKAGSREGQAGEDRSEGFDGLVVHITPSLSVWIVVRISRLHSARYVNKDFLTNFFLVDKLVVSHWRIGGLEDWRIGIISRRDAEGAEGI